MRAYVYSFISFKNFSGLSDGSFEKPKIRLDPQKRSNDDFCSAI